MSCHPRPWPILPALIWLLMPTEAGARPAGLPCVPVAVDDSFTVVSGGALLGQVTANDPATCNFAVVVFVDPAQALSFSFHQSSGAFIYEPVPGFVGTDTFRYGIGVVDPAFATVRINVVAPPQPTTTSTTTSTITSTTTTTTTTTPTGSTPATSLSPSTTPGQSDPATTTTAPATTPPQPAGPATGRLPATR